MDNFNATASQDQFLDVMLKYRCRILFTTRSRYENHISLEVGERNPDTLLELVGKFFPEAEKKQDEISQTSLIDEKAESYVHAVCHPDNAYADVQISGVQYAIVRESAQTHLCQTWLDSINDLWFTDMPPAEYAIVSFENRTIQPLLNAHPWFAAGNFGIDCAFKDDGRIDLPVHYCANRYKQKGTPR